MSTIQERLREPLFLLDSDQGCIADSQRKEAANVIDGLVQENEQLREVLDKLANYTATTFAASIMDMEEIARAALAATKCEDKT